MTMQTYKGPLNMAKCDPDCLPSAAHTIAPFQQTDDFPEVMWCANALKQGMPLMYWSTIAVCRNALYAFDVRQLPGVTESQAQEHADVLFNMDDVPINQLTLDHSAQRDVALKLIRLAFKSQAEMLTWMEEQHRMQGAAVMLHKVGGAQ